jgi:hypothetical protein
MPPRRHGDQSGLRARTNRCAGYGRGGGLPTLHPLFASYGQAYPEVEAEIAASEKLIDRAAEGFDPPASGRARSSPLTWSRYGGPPLRNTSGSVLHRPQ